MVHEMRLDFSFSLYFMLSLFIIIFYEKKIMTFFICLYNVYLYIMCIYVHSFSKKIIHQLDDKFIVILFKKHCTFLT